MLARGALRQLAWAGCTLALVACGGDDDTPPPIDGGGGDGGGGDGGGGDGATTPTFLDVCREELMLGDDACAEVAGWRLPEALPPSRGNMYADDERAATLGRRIFFDGDFATVEGVSCSSCHLPDRAFQDGLDTSEVIPGTPVTRNSPSLYNVAWNEGYWFWDGRADSLWSQPLFAFENPIEMNVTRLAIAHRIADDAAYRTAYEEIFGALPALEDAARFPATGKPGEPSWDGMTDKDRDAVNRVVANVGKSLEAYMRRIASGDSAMDRFIDGELDALSTDARTGLVRFVESECTSCHYGHQLVDSTFHQVSMPDADRGRASGIETLLANPFNSAGPYFDVGAGEPLPLPAGPGILDENAFRTPTMRNVPMTGPYVHNGSRDLDTILTSDPHYAPGDEVVLTALLEALVGATPPVEWTTPP